MTMMLRLRYGTRTWIAQGKDKEQLIRHMTLVLVSLLENPSGAFCLRSRMTKGTFQFSTTREAKNIAASALQHCVGDRPFRERTITLQIP